MNFATWPSLRNEGILTHEEFAVRKALLLARGT
jgi:hypothetical protein